MMLSLPKLFVGGAVLLITFHACAVQGASVRHHRQRGGEAEDRRPGAYFTPNSDMIKALEYIESLKQRTGGLEDPTTDYDEIEKFRVLLQLASLQDESTPDRDETSQWHDGKGQQWVKALLRKLQEQATKEANPVPVRGNERRAHNSRHFVADADSPAVATGDYGSYVKPHKKYPLMFEDEDNTRESAYKRATEDVEEQYTPQSLANLRSIFEELGKLSSTTNQKGGTLGEDQALYRDGDDDDDDMYRVRNLAYEDVTGGEEWVPLEEKVETEEVEKGSHEEFDRGLEDSYEENDNVQRRASQPAFGGKGDSEDDTKLVDYYLLKILEMRDQAQKREVTEEKDIKKRHVRPALIDPQAVNQLLEISLKLHIPPEDLIELLITEEMRQKERHPQALVRYKIKTPKTTAYDRRVHVNGSPTDLTTEEILNILGLESLGNQNTKYFLNQKPYKAAPSRIPVPTSRRGDLFQTEIDKVSHKRKDYYDDTVDEDELATFLATKMLTQYPNKIHFDQKRAIESKQAEHFPYEIYEQAMKDYFDQVNTEKSPPVKRDTKVQDVVNPPETQENEDNAQETLTTDMVKEAKDNHGNKLAGM